MRTAILIALGAAACKGGEPTDTPPDVDCVADETTQTLQQVAAPDWPEGLQDRIDAYRELDGRWTADACGETINVAIRTIQVLDTDLDLVTSPLPEGNICGCTLDPDEPKDGDLTVMARTTMDIFFQDYPEEGFREESAGNLANVPVAFFGGGTDMLMRACTTAIVPPILLLDYRDTEVAFRVDASGPSATVTLVGPDVADASCDVTGWVRVGDNQ